MKDINPEERLYTENIESEYWKDGSLFYSIIAEEKDWWKEICIGRNSTGNIQWLEMDKPPAEQSILKAQFITIAGFSNPLLEVHGQTHLGNGALYVYKINNTDLKLLLTVSGAVDSYMDSAARPGNYERYGYHYCGKVIQNGALESTYSDINNDGMGDIKLHGVTDVVCNKDIGTIKVDSMRINKNFIWDSDNGRFIPLNT